MQSNFSTHSIHASTIKLLTSYSILLQARNKMEALMRSMMQNPMLAALASDSEAFQAVLESVPQMREVRGTRNKTQDAILRGFKPCKTWRQFQQPAVVGSSSNHHHHHTFTLNAIPFFFVGSTWNPCTSQREVWWWFESFACHKLKSSSLFKANCKSTNKLSREMLLFNLWGGGWMCKKWVASEMFPRLLACKLMKL